MLLDECQCLNTVVRFGHDFHVPLVLQVRHDARPHNGMIIGNHDPNLRLPRWLSLAQVWLWLCVGGHLLHGNSNICTERETAQLLFGERSASLEMEDHRACGPGKSVSFSEYEDRPSALSAGGGVCGAGLSAFWAAGGTGSTANGLWSQRRRTCSQSS